MDFLWLGCRIIMAHRPMTTRELYKGATRLPTKNILNTTLVTQLEVIEDGVVKYYNWNNNAKVIALIDDTHKTLRIYINHKNK
jgi:hypothetical protein